MFTNTVFQILSTEETKVELIEFNQNPFNNSTEEDKMRIEKYLKDLYYNSTVLHELYLRECQLTDDLLMPIVHLLKFVKEIYLAENELTFQSLYNIFKVIFFSY